jgi:hypothetical protein
MVRRAAVGMDYDDRDAVVFASSFSRPVSAPNVADMTGNEPKAKVHRN